MGPTARKPGQTTDDLCSPANSEYCVEVVIYKHCSLIEVSKFRGQHLLWQASGATFYGAMAQATMYGMEPDE